jgi:hypothetical protein
MTAESIARELHGRKSGAGWVCRCPAHEDHSPSLSIRETAGKLLVHCHAGCYQENVIEALRLLGLWPESNLSPAQRRDFARQRRLDEADVEMARTFGDAAAILAEERLESLALADPQRRPLTRLLAMLRTDSGTLAEYREWIMMYPSLACALVAAGRKRRERLEMLLTNYLAMPEARNAG